MAITKKVQSYEVNWLSVFRIPLTSSFRFSFLPPLAHVVWSMWWGIGENISACREHILLGSCNIWTQTHFDISEAKVSSICLKKHMLCIQKYPCLHYINNHRATELIIWYLQLAIYLVWLYGFLFLQLSAKGWKFTTPWRSRQNHTGLCGLSYWRLHMCRHWTYLRPVCRPGIFGSPPHTTTTRIQQEFPS